MGIIDTAKDVYDLLGKGANLELQEAVMKLREEALTLQEDNLRLRERATELESRMAQVGEMKFLDGVYWRQEIETVEPDGPFCQRCFDSDGKLLRLHPGESSYHGSVSRWWDCKSCNTHYKR